MSWIPESKYKSLTAKEKGERLCILAGRLHKILEAYHHYNGMFRTTYEWVENIRRDMVRSMAYHHFLLF